jgi:hypothetical protein
MLDNGRLCFWWLIDRLPRTTCFFFLNRRIICNLTYIFLRLHWILRNIASCWVFFQLITFMNGKSFYIGIVILFFIFFQIRFILLYLRNDDFIFRLFVIYLFCFFLLFLRIILMLKFVSDIWFLLFNIVNIILHLILKYFLIDLANLTDRSVIIFKIRWTFYIKYKIFVIFNWLLLFDLQWLVPGFYFIWNFLNFFFIV